MTQTGRQIMSLTAPIYSLKHLARAISRTEKIPLHAALDNVANDNGYDNSTLLSKCLKLIHLNG